MKNDVFEQCYQFNMERKYFEKEVLTSYERTLKKVEDYLDHKRFKAYLENDDSCCASVEHPLAHVDFIFWNNHPYWAFLLLEVYDDPDFLDCAKTVRKIAYTYRDLPTHTGLINYDMYQVAPNFC